jgi:hypothetical protein
MLHSEQRIQKQQIQMSYFIIFGMIQQGIEHATLCSQGEHADTIGGGFMLFGQ